MKNKVVDMDSAFAKLLIEGDYLARIPKAGDAVTGKVISSSRREVRIDIAGVTTGVVRGSELFAESKIYEDVNVGDEVEATVIDMDNENGEVELSFRFAGQKKAWEDLRQKFTTGDIVAITILEANKGGLIVRINHIIGFLPVSQLSPEHYPRVSGGDKSKILEKLKSYVGGSMDVRIIDVNEVDNKLIVSEKNVWEERQKNVISQYKVGDMIEGTITAVADFGAFVRFDSLEGLIHISEIAWQRIDHPGDLLKVGESIKAEIIGIEGSKIFLSIKKLLGDPWAGVEEKYKKDDMVEGKILKVNPFGFFVELDEDIHGLAHISELSDSPVTDISELGKEGEVMQFRIVSIEPKEHRLGLSLRPPKKDKEEGEEKKEKEETKDEPEAEKPTPEEIADEVIAEETPAEEKAE